MSFKEVLFKFSFLYNFIPLKLLMRLAKKKILLPFYHIVDEKNNVLTSHLYTSKNEHQFLKDIQYLKKILTPLSIECFTSNINHDSGFFLTFDDGLSNFHKIVAPILEKENIPALNFISSNFIDNQSLFFRYKVNIILRELNHQNNIDDKLSIVSFLHSATQKNETEIDKIATDLNICFDSFLKKEQPYLSTYQIKNLLNKGFYIGAHSKSHPYYNTLNIDKQLEETIDSVEIIKEIFNIPYSFFSFPFSDNGVSKSFFNQIANNQIYSFGTAGLKDENLTNHFQRIPMEYQSVYSAKTLIKGELIYYLLKKIINQHQIKRN